MSLRPRYSLLTLLILTALVAGGVKLWHGPHHVVERTAANNEVEYMFTRDWRGERILAGTYVTRSLNTDPQEWHWADVSFYRAGTRFKMSYSWMHGQQSAVSSDAPVEISMMLDLTPEERSAWSTAIEQERQRLAAQGWLPAGAWFIHWPHK